MTSVALPMQPEVTRIESVKQRTIGDKVELAWIWTSVFYSIARFAVAWGGFGDHGVNPWIFGIIDVGTAFPYAKASATLCRRVANAEWSRLAMPLIVSVVTFFAPYAYLWFAAGEMPAGLRAGVGIFIAIMFAAATVGVITKARRIRRETAAEAAGPSDIDTVVVDIREGTDQGITVLAALDSTERSGDTVHEIDLRDGPPRSAMLIDLTGETVAINRTA